ncbi:MAG: cysteine--tRNA ligase, partial [Dialister sp.]|nr:cysteine--tRNA ligase [Dialister sp.]
MEEIKVYNTLTKEKEVFHPIKEGEAKIYVCGVTPYNHPHIGNARPAVTWDIIRRYLEFIGYKVTFVQNFTDVDDKIINKANAEGSDWKTISDRYIDAYFEVMDKLHVRRADMYPRVSDHMKDIIDMVKTLIEKGHAYVLGGDVYYDISTFKDYGKLSGRKIEDMLAGARIEVNDEKRNPGDFALWKAAKPGEPFWESPWGKGRPGWHTECVVMINKNLGPLIDIHGGGMDLRFPHHENEAAQQECTHHNSLANYWIHNAMININGQKMSKSLGNTLWAQDVVDRLGTNLTRWLMSSVLYRKELNFSDETVETARKELDKVMNPMRSIDVKAALNGVTLECAWDEAAYRSFLDQLDDDLNTPNAYTVIFEQAKKLNQMLRVREPDWNQAALTRNAIEKMLNILGIVVEKPEVSDEDRA